MGLLQCVAWESEIRNSRCLCMRERKGWGRERCQQHQTSILTHVLASAVVMQVDGYNFYVMMMSPCTCHHFGIISLLKILCPLLA